jgi:predicted deacylase
MHEDAGVLQTQRKMGSCFPNVWHWGTPYLPGRTISAAKENSVPAIYLELQGKGGVESSDLEIIREGFANIIKTFGFVSGEPKHYAPAGLRESTLGQEGHLQVENPAPCDGLLMQIVESGKRVLEGEILAVVQPLDGGAPREVLAAHPGRAVMVRRFRALKKDDALAVIVDI